jgi:hypothetical protein
VTVHHNEEKQMVRKSGVLMCVAVGAFLAGMLASPNQTAQAQAQAMDHVFELRTYTTEEGQLPMLLARFGGGETALFEKHGMTGVGYWVPVDEPESQNTLVYLLAHESREAAAASWRAFGGDPEWRTMREAQPVTLTNLVSVFMSPTDFSPAR